MCVHVCLCVHVYACVWLRCVCACVSAVKPAPLASSVRMRRTFQPGELLLHLGLQVPLVAVAAPRGPERRERAQRLEVHRAPGHRDEGPTDRQADRQTGRQTGRQTDRPTDRLTH